MESINNFLSSPKEILDTEKAIVFDRDRIVDRYDVNLVHQQFPSKVQTMSRAFENLLTDTSSLPVRVDTGRMAIVNLKRPILTDGVQGCIVGKIQSSNAKALFHSVSNDNPQQYGYWKEKDAPYDFDPVPNTVERILGEFSSSGESPEIVTLISNEKNEYGKIQVVRLAEEFRRHGLECKIIDIKCDTSLVYDDADGTLIVGAVKDKNATHVWHQVVE